MLTLEELEQGLGRPINQNGMILPTNSAFNSIEYKEYLILKLEKERKERSRKFITANVKHLSIGCMNLIGLIIGFIIGLLILFS